MHKVLRNAQIEHINQTIYILIQNLNVLSLWIQLLNYI